MRNVQKIIDAQGGMAALKATYIRLEVPGFMPLVVEYVGRGPRGGDLVSVCHYGRQNGDPMRDPEIVFEIVDGQWQPVSIQQDYVGSFREAVSLDDAGKILVNPFLVRDIAAFARIWDRNLKLQSFVAAAEAQAGR